MPRVILHADMDAFYASVEQRDNPDLREKPLVVGGPIKRGVVSAASYEARRFGIHSAMPMSQALRLYPALIMIPPRMKVYATVSRQIFAIFESYTPLVEPLSLDEAFLDLAGTERLHGPPLQIARAIKDRVRQELNLVVSIGIGPSKFVAKIASDIGKPDGLVIVQREEVTSFLHPLPIHRLFGVGKVTENILLSLGIRTIGDLAVFPRDLLIKRFGTIQGEHLWSLSQGHDDREVIVNRNPESIGQEDTFAKDLTKLEDLGPLVRTQADRVACRLREEGFLARVVILKVKTSEFKIRTRRRTLPRPTCDGNLIGKVAQDLLSHLLPHVGPIRLTGVTATGLVEEKGPRQLSFQESEEDHGAVLGHTLDQITAKFGKNALVRGTSLIIPSKRNR